MPGWDIGQELETCFFSSIFILDFRTPPAVRDSNFFWEVSIYFFFVYLCIYSSGGCPELTPSEPQSPFGNNLLEN